jgi:hypothetical protein
MLTFILSVILTSFICLCFFKKNFWENRYLVLLISGGVALVATTTINFAVRGHLSTKTETTWVKPMKTFYVSTDLMLKDMPHLDSLSPEQVKLPIIKDYDYYNSHKATEFYKDTTKKQTPVTILFYQYGKTKEVYVGTFTAKGNQDYWLLEDVYLQRSSADTVAYVSKKKQYYDVKPNNWITGFSIPRKSVITILHVPPREFDMIQDSLIRPIPF